MVGKCQCCQSVCLPCFAVSWGRPQQHRPLLPAVPVAVGCRGRVSVLCSPNKATLRQLCCQSGRFQTIPIEFLVSCAVTSRALAVVSGERKTLACHQPAPRPVPRGEEPSPGVLRGRRCHRKGFSFPTLLPVNEPSRSLLTPGFPFLFVRT